MTKTRALRTALVAGLCTLAACVVNLGFDMTRTIAVASAGTATSMSQSQVVNLSDYKEVQEHQGSIRSLDLDSLDLSVQSVNARNRATVVNGTMELRKSLTDVNETPVRVGTLTNFSLAQGSTVRLAGTPAVDAFLYQQVQNGGTFYIVVAGNLDQAPIDVVLNVTMHSSMGYDAGL